MGPHNGKYKEKFLAVMAQRRRDSKSNTERKEEV